MSKWNNFRILLRFEKCILKKNEEVKFLFKKFEPSLEKYFNKNLYNKTGCVERNHVKFSNYLECPCKYVEKNERKFLKLSFLRINAKNIKH